MDGDRAEINTETIQMVQSGYPDFQPNSWGRVSILAHLWRVLKNLATGRVFGAKTQKAVRKSPGGCASPAEPVAEDVVGSRKSSAVVLAGRQMSTCRKKNLPIR